MKLIDIFTSGIVAMLLGLLLIVGAGTSFGANAGVIVFSYGVFAVIYVGCSKVFG